MRCFSCLMIVFVCGACTRARHAPPAAAEPARESLSPAPLASAQSHESESRWLQVLKGGLVWPVAGTNYLHDETGKIWFAVNGSEVVPVPSLSLDRLHGVSPEKSNELLRGARVVWAVGEATGPRYALVQSAEASCSGAGNFFLERDDQAWHYIDEPPSDRSPPLALANGEFSKGIGYIDSMNSCGHGGPPFDYDVHTRGATNDWPSPRRFTTAWMTGRQTFSEVAFLAYTITPQGDLIVLGRSRHADPTDGIDWGGLALEIFRKGAKKTEIIPVPLDDMLEEPTIAAVSSREFVVSGTITNWLNIGSYKDGTWSWTHDGIPDGSIWYDQVREELMKTPLLVDGVPFDLHRVFRHPSLYWLVGKVGDVDFVFAERPEGRAFSK